MKNKIINNSDVDFDKFSPFLRSLLDFARQKLGFQHSVCIKLSHDDENASNYLGKTGFYEPSSKTITVFTANRHPKDILRSISHELVHHNQNCNNKFADNKPLEQFYFQNNDEMKELEREAYEIGNMTFRDWEEKYRKQLKESIYYNKGETKMKINEWKSYEMFSRLSEAFGYGSNNLEESSCGDNMQESNCGSRMEEGICPVCGETPCACVMEEGMCLVCGEKPCSCNIEHTEETCKQCGKSPCMCPPIVEKKAKNQISEAQLRKFIRAAIKSTQIISKGNKNE